MDGERKDLEKKMAKIRQVARLYAERNEGKTPSGAFDDTEIEEEEDLFDDSDF
jgi:hypothetical protein